MVQSEKLNSNAYNLLRLIAAFGVLFSHAFILGGYSADPLGIYTNNQIDFGSASVITFFAISGSLISQSAIRSNFLDFFWKRFLRIFPSYWLTLFLCAFALGPFVWNLDGKSTETYFSFAPDGPFQYLLSNLFLKPGNWGIYNIFENSTPWGNLIGISVINGSTWSLFTEWCCYLLVGITILFGGEKVLKIVSPSMLVALTYFDFLAQNDKSIWGESSIEFFANENATRVSIAFFAGSTIWLYLGPKINSIWVALVSLSGVILLLFANEFSALGVILLSLGILSTGNVLPAKINKFASKNDISYGVYLFAFPISQLLAYLGLNQYGFLLYVIFIATITSAAAWILWLTLEKPLSRFKNIVNNRVAK